MLELRHIVYKYEEQPLLRDISFSVQQDETVCLLGPSGGGKTTILRIIAGLENPAGGIVYWNGADVSKLPAHNREFGLMFQDYALFPHLNVYENVAFGLRMKEKSDQEVADRVEESLEIASLQHLAGRSVVDLSGGEKQRVAFARAIAPEPKLLMLDEPMGSLDRTLRDQLLGELNELLNAADIPVIYVTHDQEEAFSIADRVILLHDGVIVQSGSPREIYKNPVNLWVAAFFGLTNRLRGKILSKVPGIVETEIGKIFISCGKDVFSVGEPVELIIPPDAFRVGESECGENNFKGMIVDCSFRGTSYYIKIKMQNAILLTFEVADAYQAGDGVKLSIDKDAFLCFAEGS